MSLAVEEPQLELLDLGLLSTAAMTPAATPNEKAEQEEKVQAEGHVSEVALPRLEVLHEVETVEDNLNFGLVAPTAWRVYAIQVRDESFFNTP